MARLGADVDRPAMAVHDAGDRCKAQARSHPMGLGGEERLEDPRHGRGIHAATIVADVDAHIVAGRQEAAPELHPTVAIGRNQRAALGHLGAFGPERSRPLAVGPDRVDLECDVPRATFQGMRPVET